MEKKLSLELKSNISRLETILNCMAYIPEEEDMVYSNEVSYNEKSREFYIYTKTGSLQSASMKYVFTDFIKAINIVVNYGYNIDLNYISNIVEKVKHYILECKDKIMVNENEE